MEKIVGNTVVLAFDIERTGAKLEHQTIAIGLSIVDENFNQLDSLLLKGYHVRDIPKTGAPEGFEERSWNEFWFDKQEHLGKIATDNPDSQRDMIIAFQEFRRKWELKSEQEGFVLEICSDNPVYDCWFLNDMISRYTGDHPMPYQAKAISYQQMWDTDSALRGILALADPSYKSTWGLSDHIRKLYNIDSEPISYDHMPHHDAYNIACDLQIIIGIRDSRIKKNVKFGEHFYHESIADSSEFGDL